MWRTFSQWYFEPKRFEKTGNGLLYRRLGIRFFKRYLPTSGDIVSRWRGMARIRRSEGGLDQALRGYERVTRTHEARHIVGALSMLAISWWAIVLHDRGQWPALIIANVIINGYPIMLQRYNRIRLETAMARFVALRGDRKAKPQPISDA